jgi:glutamine synthetase
VTKEQLDLLKEIAKTCRKAGISYFKNQEFEFTLTDAEPKAQKPRGRPAAKKAQATSSQSELVEGEGFDSLSPEDQLLWSSGAFAASEGQ